MPTGIAIRGAVEQGSDETLVTLKQFRGRFLLVRHEASKLVWSSLCLGVGTRV